LGKERRRRRRGASGCPEIDAGCPWRFAMSWLRGMPVFRLTQILLSYASRSLRYSAVQRPLIYEDLRYHTPAYPSFPLFPRSADALLPTEPSSSRRLRTVLYDQEPLVSYQPKFANRLSIGDAAKTIGKMSQNLTRPKIHLGPVLFAPNAGQKGIGTRNRRRHRTRSAGIRSPGRKLHPSMNLFQTPVSVQAPHPARLRGEQYTNGESPPIAHRHAVCLWIMQQINQDSLDTTLPTPQESLDGDLLEECFVPRDANLGVIEPLDKT
jgi:hypothetical protein